MKKLVLFLSLSILSANLDADPMWAFNLRNHYLAAPDNSKYMTIRFYAVTSKFGKQEQVEEENVEFYYSNDKRKILEKRSFLSESKEYTLRFEYDEKGRIVAENGLRADGTELLMTKYEYGKDGIIEYSCLGEDIVLSAKETTYDSLNREIEWTSYDQEGKVSLKCVTEYKGNIRIMHSYDSDGEEYEIRKYEFVGDMLTRETIFRITDSEPEEPQFIIIYRYDEKDRLIREERQNTLEDRWAETIYSYNEAGNLIEKVDVNEKDSTKAVFQYDSLAQLIGIDLFRKKIKFGKASWDLENKILREISR